MSLNVLVLVTGGQSPADVVAPLRTLGMDVTVAESLAQRLAALRDSDLIVVDAPSQAALAMLCRQVIDEAGSDHPPVIAVAQSGDVEARVELLEAGADDVVARPVDERELAAIVDALTRRGTASRQTPASPAQRNEGSAATPGRVIAFAAAKGGSGATTLAVNTAVLLAEMAPGNVAIADMDMSHGQVSTHLDIYGRTSTAALAREEHHGLGPELLRETGRAHASGLVVFGAPYRPDEAQDISGDALASVVDSLSAVYGTVIVDVGSTLDMRSLPILDRANRVAMVVTPDIPALRLLHSALQVMSDAGSVDDRMLFVVNHVYPRASIGPEQIEEHLGLRIGLTVPYDGEGFVKAVNDGQPLVLAQRRGAPALAIKRLADTLSGNEPVEEEAPEPPRRRKLLGGLRGRS